MGTTSEGFSVINAFLNFANLGAEWVMWLLIGLGVVAVALVLERLWLYARTKVDAPSIARRLVTALDADDLDEARALVARGGAMEERVLSDALEAWPKGAKVVEQIMASSVERERQRFDRFLGYFGTLGNNAPFIGLLGTVIGIIVSFQQLAANPKGGLEVVGPGIAEALVATAVGLVVAIPAVIAFNTCKAVVKERLGNTDFLGRIVLAQLNEKEA
jgi:biopolymer transport protein ExbB/TolQ